MDKRPGVIRPLFNRMAESYDLGNRLLSLSIDILWRRRTVRSLRIRDGQSILDIATGTADLALEAIGRADCRVTGIDFSEEMLHLARAKRDAAPHPERCAFVQGDACAMPFRDGAFHRAMISFGVRNVQDMDRLFRETIRVLQPGGRFAILEFTLPTAPAVRSFYLFYFRRVLPVIGGLLTGKREPYEYLRDSVLDFESPQALEERLVRNGFILRSSTPFTLGICRLYVADKPQ
jgi:demethylmenaquinone methyltransferase/2-methoxy-6-polyprenyl-1,4-benzoquinol methylase